MAKYDLTDVASVRQALADDAEFALIDVREAGQYGEGHPFFCVNIPYSRLELEAPHLLPNPSTKVVLVDDDDGVAARAAACLARAGYSNVAVLDGGAPAWAASGGVLYKGVNLPSKTFGELVEHAFDTPHISAATLDEWAREGANMIVLDGRTPAEYTKMSIPGARSCPNAELGLRIDALVDDPQTTIVVNCAGRTRSIIGAENLRVLGLPNPIVALENGTQGWQLAGFELNRGKPAEALPELDSSQRSTALARASELIERYQIPWASIDDLRQWRTEPRSLYVLDVRSAPEFAKGHLPGSRHAPGGQLAQSTDHWVGARGGRIVLVDDLHIRAALTARWLRCMGHDARILALSPEDLNDPSPAPEVTLNPEVPELTLAQLSSELAAGTSVLDFSPSMTYREVHLTGSTWAIRPRIDTLGLAPGAEVVAVGESSSELALAVRELQGAGVVVKGIVLRDRAKWAEAGLALGSSDDVPLDAQCIDYLFFVHDRHAGNMEAAKAYLAWETGLIGQLAPDERAKLQPR